MGLCKCARRRVTNLFCFEHNVSVCEHCIVSEHPACVIKSYLHWLDDSEYDPTCPFGWCRRTLKDAECARLICYHVFHWNCLNKHFTQDLPANTAPAGYQCPLCKRCVFPAPNHASPVADALRKKLETVEWGRLGLSAGAVESHHSVDMITNGASLAGSEQQQFTRDADNATPHRDITSNPNGLPHLSGQAITSVGRSTGGGAAYRNDINIPSASGATNNSDTRDLQLTLPPPQPHSMHDAGTKTAFASSKHRHHTDPFDSGRQQQHGAGSSADNIIYDADAEKYQRRSFLNQFSRLFRNRFVASRRRVRGGPACKYACLILIIGLAVLFGASMILTGVTRGGGRNVAELVGHHAGNSGENRRLMPEHVQFNSEDVMA